MAVFLIDNQITLFVSILINSKTEHKKAIILTFTIKIKCMLILSSSKLLLDTIGRIYNSSWPKQED